MPWSRHEVVVAVTFLWIPSTYRTDPNTSVHPLRSASSSGGSSLVLCWGTPLCHFASNSPSRCSALLWPGQASQIHSSWILKSGQWGLVLLDLHSTCPEGTSSHPNPPTPQILRRHGLQPFQGLVLWVLSAPLACQSQFPWLTASALPLMPLPPHLQLLSSYSSSRLYLKVYLPDTTQTGSVLPFLGSHRTLS